MRASKHSVCLIPISVAQLASHRILTWYFPVCYMFFQIRFKQLGVRSLSNLDTSICWTKGDLPFWGICKSRCVKQMGIMSLGLLDTSICWTKGNLLFGGILKNRFVEQKGNSEFEQSGHIDLLNKKEFAMLGNLEKSICGTKGELQVWGVWKSLVVEQKVTCHIKETVKVDLRNERVIAIVRSLQRSICGTNGGNGPRLDASCAPLNNRWRSADCGERASQRARDCHASNSSRAPRYFRGSPCPWRAQEGTNCFSFQPPNRPLYIRRKIFCCVLINHAKF